MGIFQVGKLIVAGVFLGVLLPHAIHAAECDMYTTDTTIISGFGSPFDIVNNPNQSMMRASCLEHEVSLELGNGNQTTYIYNIGYVYRNGGWQQLNYSGSNLQANNWYAGSANGTIALTSAELVTGVYMVSYQCQWGGVWKCGCRTAVCTGTSGNLWQLQFVKTSAVVSPSLSPGTILWSAGVETGDDSEWYRNGGGGQFPSGNAQTSASTEQAHSGRYSLKQVINTSGGVSATRTFRWAEGRTQPELHYSLWHYIPNITANSGWWIMEGWKVKEVIANGSEQTYNLLMLELDPADPNEMYLRLKYRKPGDPESKFVFYTQRVKPMPANRWFRIEAYVKSSTGNDGEFRVWLDGTEIFHLTNIVTRPTAGRAAPEWEIASYGTNLLPNPLTTFVDDAVISRVRLP